MMESAWKLGKEDWITRRSHLRVRRWGVSQAVISLPPLPPPHLPTTGHLLPDTPLFITLWGEISLLHSHVPCKTIRSSAPNLHPINIVVNYVLLLFHWSKNIIQLNFLLSKSFTNVNAPSYICVTQNDRLEYRGQMVGTLTSVFFSFPMFSLLKNVFSPQKCFLSSAKTLSTSSATAYHWRVKRALLYVQHYEFTLRKCFYVYMFKCALKYVIPVHVFFESTPFHAHHLHCRALKNTIRCLWSKGFKLDVG